MEGDWENANIVIEKKRIKETKAFFMICKLVVKAIQKYNNSALSNRDMKVDEAVIFTFMKCG
jgi:hypothetical protein